ncbi:hypothetical protein G647_04587 [Cladophialophora carrionii CBS 160.54]|uniref:DNA replication checkpoint mediator MRC1 domain-containing protein n=1 Tax=Cladophialophora carrionii CBS 160.54 TaxID=1279043 RepID=V9DE80_9EURO|nr:uncharacterized protein G647_04587 [Cladophialophora carrionii CBS 160.54]ETI25214.1 hypothetical protein G647_04587 [Cladophialophora carrionii CBS 160.54]
MASSPVSPSIVGSPRSTTSILTPTRKVQALLAQFSDSESDNNAPALLQTGQETAVSQSHGVAEVARPTGSPDDSEDEDILAPRRLTASRQIITATPDRSPHHDRNDALESVLGREAGKDDKLFSNSEEDETWGLRHTANLEGSNSGSRSPSPLFFPSPDGHKSKFLALVEKHRKQRQEKEALEAEKRAMQLQSLKAQKQGQRKPRGSSPADDTGEDSDVLEETGGNRLSKQARPTRKASKKALEEMNRETQRISRNMQLAHQARTKKKISKDSLLARFNFPVAASKTERDHELSATSSSRAPSENEAENRNDTPPTSPPAGLVSPKLYKGKERASSLEPLEQAVRTLSRTMPGSNEIGEQPLAPSVKPLKEPGKFKISSFQAINSDDDESGSDLEVITSRADKRKYAVFEHLRTRKAKEAPSHIALRSLANLIKDDRKRSGSAAEVEAHLRRLAREQAQQEKQHRLDELMAKGVVIQTAEEREREQQEVEDLLERARQEAAEIQKREKAAAKKEGNYTKDDLDDEEESDDEDFAVEDDDGDNEDSAEDDDVDGGDSEDEEPDEIEGTGQDAGSCLDNEAEEHDSAESSSAESPAEMDNDASDDATEDLPPVNLVPRKSRLNRVVSDDEEGHEDQLPSPELPAPAKTPQTLTRSARKQIPGLQMSDDLPIGLTQAFDATMADSQSQELPFNKDHDSLQMSADLPSPNIAMVPKLYRLDSIDVITDSQPASQTQPVNVNLSFSQSDIVPQSPAIRSAADGMDMTPPQPQFEPTQDGGYVLSPFMGNRFATETPRHPLPHSSVDTIVLANDLQDSPIMQRKSRLRRGRATMNDSDDEAAEAKDSSAFVVMQRAAAKQSREAFDKQKSRAREAVDDAAEESEDEYAGLGGASDDEINDEENEDDRRMIDEDTQVGVGDEAKLAKLFADRERQQDEAAVSKLLKDITTGALRRKRGNDDLDLSDEEDALMRRREAKRREFAKMRRELLKDEAVGKIAEDKKKEAFLRSIEDRPNSDDDDDFERPETQPEGDSEGTDSQNIQSRQRAEDNTFQRSSDTANLPLAATAASKLNQGVHVGRRNGIHINRKPGTLAEIRESVFFLIEEPDSQAGTVDLGLSDSEDDAEAYVDLDRHLQAAEADENAADANDLGDFIVDDDDDGQAEEETMFKKPALPASDSRAPFSDRRTKERVNVVNRLSMLRQQSSSGSSGSTKMAFYTSTSSTNSSFSKVPALLRRATTNSSLGSMAGRDENVSATGVVTNKTERGKASDEKTFVRKGTGGRRNAVNYRPTVREEKMSQRAGVAKQAAAKAKKGGFLGVLFNGGSWN